MGNGFMESKGLKLALLLNDHVNCQFTLNLRLPGGDVLNNMNMKQGSAGRVQACSVQLFKKTDKYSLKVTETG